MTRRIGPILFTVAVAAAACSPGTPTVPGVRASSIVNGERELGEDAVVYVQGVIGSCTGTLITDRVVLTAKHCVQSRGQETPAPPSFFAVGIGNRSGDVRSVRVRSIETTPGGFFGSAITDGSDIALMILREPVTDVTPIPIRREAAGGVIGLEVTAIGFGQTPAGEVGIKYRTTTTIEGSDSGVLFGRNAICQGDSGGPIILEADGARRREVVGIASYGQSMVGGVSCPAVLDAWNRIDVHLDLVDRAILRSGGCVERGEETCNSLDDDCNGTIDDGCAALGDACETDDDCAYGPLPELLRDGAPASTVCADAGGSRRCALPCDALTPDAGCDAIDVAFTTADVSLEGFYCAQTAGCDGLCVRGSAGTGGNGEACSADTDCATLFCADLGVCATPCLGGAGACPFDEVCFADGAACGLCANPSTRPTGRGLGERCDDVSQCAPLACGDLEGARICTQPCVTDTDCGASFHCASGWCANGARAELFGTCREDMDCAGSSCIERDGHPFCATPCVEGGSCPGTCTAIEGEMRCFPAEPLLGEACTDACAEGECMAGVCTASCGGESACPLGYDCAREGTTTVCRPRASAGGGCAVTGAAGGSWPALASLAIAVALLGARRRARVG